MARQLSDGTWTSKCGGNEDIVHVTLDALEKYGMLGAYGCPAIYLKRPVVIGSLIRFLQRVLWSFEKVA
jgi:hypothetical protein